MRRRMHQTTVRFGRDLWAELGEEAGRCGVSVAAWVRDAAIERLALSAVAREAPLGGSAQDRFAVLARHYPQLLAELTDETRSLTEETEQTRRKAQRARQAARTIRSTAATRGPGDRTLPQPGALSSPQSV